jgi:hypothetical protein
MDSGIDAVAVAASVTRAVKLEVPVDVGVPVIAPVVVLSVRPDGKEPAVIDHVRGSVPPVAFRVRE